MAFDVEDKIGWEELAPSLQAMFGSSKWALKFEDIMKNGDNGQIVKIDAKNKTFDVDDNMHILRITNNATEVTEMKRLGPIELKEVFRSWDRISAWRINDQNSNSGDQTAARNSYRYVDSNKSIYMDMNPDCTSGFISEKLYSKFWIHMRMWGLENTGFVDDDSNIFILGYMIDKANTFHDISIIRVGNAARQWDWMGGTFCIAYNFVAAGGWQDQSNVKILAYSNPANTSWAAGTFIEFYAEKVPGKIYGKTADRNQRTFNSAYDITYELPNTKPAGWSDADWENLQYMMLNPTPLGFGVQSQNSRFEIVEQKEIFEVSDIYDFDTDSVYAYVKGDWVKVDKVSDVLPRKTWLYNPELGNLYWYSEPGVYKLIDTNTGAALLNSAKEGQLIKIGKMGVNIEDNYYSINAIGAMSQTKPNDTASVNSRHATLMADAKNMPAISEIYDLDKDEYLVRSGASWTVSGRASDKLLNNTFIYNPYLQLFYYYIEPKSYKRLIIPKA